MRKMLKMMRKVMRLECSSLSLVSIFIAICSIVTTFGTGMHIVWATIFAFSFLFFVSLGLAYKMHIAKIQFVLFGYLLIGF